MCWQQNLSISELVLSNQENSRYVADTVPFKVDKMGIDHIVELVDLLVEHFKCGASEKPSVLTWDGLVGVTLA